MSENVAAHIEIGGKIHESLALPLLNSIDKDDCEIE